MVTFNYRRIESQAKCQNYIEGYKAIDSEILAFYVNRRNDISNVNNKNTDELYSRVLTGNGIYFLFKKISGKLNIYVGKSTQGIVRCGQHINKTITSDARMYDNWEHTIYITSAVDNWSWDTVLDLERLFIGFFRSDSSKWVCLNTQSGNKGTSDIRDLNTKIAAIVSFISQERYEFNIGSIKSSKTIIDRYLEETAKSALEIRIEAEKLAKQEFQDEILSKLSKQALIDLEQGRKNREYTEFKNKVNGSSNYIMYGRIYNSQKNKKDQDVITPEKCGCTSVDEVPDEAFDGENTFIDIASKSGNMLVPVIDKLMSDDENLPINQNEALQKAWNENKLSRLKHIIEDLIFAQATSYEAYLITCETLLKCIDKHLSSLGIDSIRDFNIIPNVKYHDQYMAYARGKDKDKELRLEEIIKVGFGDNMKFDVVIANPPYQDGTKSIYPEFIDLAVRLKPKHIVMITRNNWLTSDTMKNTRDALINYGLTHVQDYPIVGEMFPDVDVGVSIFSAQDGWKGTTQIEEIRRGKVVNSCNVNLKGMPAIFMNDIEYSILDKVMSKHEESFSKEVYPQEAFRITSVMGAGRGDRAYVLDYVNQRTEEYNVGVLRQDNGIQYYNWIKREDVPNRVDLIDKYKVVACARYNNNNNPITSITALGFGTVCSSTFCPLYANEDKVKAYGAYTYIRTKFFRYLVKLLCTSGITNHSEARFSLVPTQDFTKIWTDQELYSKYGLTQEEIDYIESEICALD